MLQKNKFKKKTIAMLIAIQFASVAHADELSTENKPQSTTIKLIEQLVEKNILSREDADKLIKDSQSQKSESSPDEENIEPDVIRVPYIPETIKQEIREQVRGDLREDVTQDVIAKGKQERWGVPGVLPTWVDRMKFFGDIRLRGQSDAYPSENVPQSYFNYHAINDAGGTTAAGNDAFFNVNEDRQRLRVRARLGMKAKVTQGWDAGIRLTTGSFTDPVSTNQTLGSYNSSYRIVLDRAYLKYTSEFKDFMFWGGRTPNQWMSTDLVWDKDVNLDGLTFKYFFNRTENPLDVDEDRFDSFITLGAYPLGEEEVFDDKWMLAIQSGFEKTFSDQSKISLGLAYYDYQNVEGKLNPTSSGGGVTDYTAPAFMQKGNSLYNIADPVSSDELYGLATDYNLLNLTFKYDIANFAPVHIYLTADYVKNVGYEINKDAKTVSALLSSPDYADEDEGYMLKVAFGWPNAKERGNWRAYMLYKEVERDAVLDAFNDSDFHLGGTDAKGYELGGQYGIDENVWLGFKWSSTDVINGEQYAANPAVPTELRPYKINTFQLDLNASF